MEPSPPLLPDDAPEEGGYGFVVQGRAVPCTRTKLLDIVSREEPALLQAVWTPETPSPVHPAAVPFLFEAYRARAQRAAKSGLRGALLQGALWAGLGIVLRIEGREIDSLLFFVIAAAFGAIPAVENAWALFRLRRTGPEWMARVLEGTRKAWRLFSRRSIATTVLAAGILAVGLAQWRAGLDHSIRVAGLDKEAARVGEVWRYLTSSYVHAMPPLHIAFNLLALLALGRLVECIAGRTAMLAIYLISVLAGAAASVYLGPQGFSVGASGGIMGLLGFLAVLALLRRRALPLGFAGSMWTSLIWMAVVGAALVHLVDNAAHAGGAAAGALIAVAFVRRGNDLPLKPGRAVAVIGILSAAVLAAGWAATLWLVLKPA